MKLYLVFNGESYEDNRLLEIFQDKGKAEEFAERYNKAEYKEAWDFRRCEIEEWDTADSKTFEVNKWGHLVEVEK